MDADHAGWVRGNGEVGSLALRGRGLAEGERRTRIKHRRSLRSPPPQPSGGDGARPCREDMAIARPYPTGLNMSDTFIANASSVNGFVSNSIPGSRCPLPTAAFSA